MSKIKKKQKKKLIKNYQKKKLIKN